METQTTTLKKVSYREVHEELIQEYNLAINFSRNNDLREIRKKADFLNGIGFTNSIAAKVYSDLSSGDGLPQKFAEKYKGQYLFIYESQLERLVEKYNLYVRPLEFYAGDIPEKNIKEMEKFTISLEDMGVQIDERFKNGLWYYEQFFKKGKMPIPPIVTGPIIYPSEISVPLSDFAPSLINEFLSIAAVKDLFLPSAFKKSSARIEKKPEITAKMQVDTDPIVLLKVPKGRIIITAWGDEANDQILARPALN